MVIYKAYKLRMYPDELQRMLIKKTKENKNMKNNLINKKNNSK